MSIPEYISSILGQNKFRHSANCAVIEMVCDEQPYPVVLSWPIQVGRAGRSTCISAAACSVVRLAFRRGKEMINVCNRCGQSPVPRSSDKKWKQRREELRGSGRVEGRTFFQLLRWKTALLAGIFEQSTSSQLECLNRPLEVHVPWERKWESLCLQSNETLWEENFFLLLGPWETNSR